MRSVAERLRSYRSSLLESLGLKMQSPSFRDDLQHIVAEISGSQSGEDRPEIRGAIRKGVSAEQWSRLLRSVLDALHPYDAIRVLSEAQVTRALEGIEERLLIHTETRSTNMRIQAASKEPWTYQWIGNLEAR